MEVKHIPTRSPKVLIEQMDTREPNLSRRQLLQGGMGLAAVSLFGVSGRANAACAPTVMNLTAGQTTVVGTVTVNNDATNIYVTYDLIDKSCAFGTLHLWIGNDLTNVPSVKNGPNAGTPIPGQFPYHSGAGSFPASTGQTSYTFKIPLTDLKIQDVASACPLTLYVLAHAEVNCEGKGETAWGGNIPVNVLDPGRWYFYFAYQLCCDTPPVIEICQTAFAKGGWVFTTDRRANPEGLPSLGLIRNRWGWAINLTAPGVTNYDIWAGAGLNKTSNGELVGTLSVSWDGAEAVVTYHIHAAGCSLKEVHLYAGDAAPTTVAPGQYGNLAYFEDPKPGTYAFTVPLADTDGKDGVWLIAHAVVCCVK